MNVAEMSFFAKISDPLLGGTYMTLLNTISNSGGSWIQTLFLSLVDFFSWKRCIFDEEIIANSTELPFENKCADKIQKEVCLSNGGTCKTDIDGYYIEVCINLIYGVVWFYFGRKLILHLQSLPLKSWYILTKKEDDSSTEISLLQKTRDKENV
jgi:MFS transporter, PAT family, solute carrier family 33 (acetyl-CoA transportor), member 1